MSLIDISEPTKSYTELNKEDFFNKEKINNREYFIGFISFKTNNSYQTKKIIINKITRVQTAGNYDKTFISYSIIRNGNIIKIENFFKSPDYYSIYYPTGFLSFQEVARTAQESLILFINKNHDLKYERF